jgi:hypothetical protein
MARTWLIECVQIGEDEDAIRRRSSFSVIHYGTSIKVDIFILKTRLFDQEELYRSRAKMLEGSDRPYLVASPEGVILNKLEWYKLGGGVSDRRGKISRECSRSRAQHLIWTTSGAGQPFWM